MQLGLSDSANTNFSIQIKLLDNFFKKEFLLHQNRDLNTWTMLQMVSHLNTLMPNPVKHTVHPHSTCITFLHSQTLLPECDDDDHDENMRLLQTATGAERPPCVPAQPPRAISPDARVTVLQGLPARPQ